MPTTAEEVKITFARLNRLDTVLTKEDRFKTFLEPRDVESINTKDNTTHKYSAKLYEFAVDLKGRGIEATSLGAKDINKHAAEFFLGETAAPEESAPESATAPAKEKPAPVEVKSDYRFPLWQLVHGMLRLAEHDNSEGHAERLEAIKRTVEVCKKTLPDM